MRLTLRTLLAWLDDTLSASEVREIGKQVSESPYAQELIERIQRVTRQRRLTVPSTTGPDATDPNLVASYLDNELDQDLVPEYEKLCLTSDVHMAEVASVHQILSLIGQKAKVPDEAKNRMYHLVRGARRSRRRRGPASPRRPRSPEPIGPWVTPPPPSRPWYERYGPAVGRAGAARLALLVGLDEPESAAASGDRAGRPGQSERGPCRQAPTPLPDVAAGPGEASTKVALPSEAGDLAAVAKAEGPPEKAAGGEPSQGGRAQVRPSSRGHRDDGEGGRRAAAVQHRAPGVGAARGPDRAEVAGSDAGPRPVPEHPVGRSGQGRPGGRDRGLLRRGPAERGGPISARPGPPGLARERAPPCRSRSSSPARTS